MQFELIQFSFYISTFLFVATIIYGGGILADSFQSKFLAILFTMCMVSATGAISIGGTDFLGHIFIRSLGIAIITTVYLIPSIIAKNRNHYNFLSIFYTNLFLGWTIIGWIIAIIWSGSENAQS